ncbi:MAG: glycosyltransferase, partial [Actinomycetota bacterium]
CPPLGRTGSTAGMSPAFRSLGGDLIPEVSVVVATYQRAKLLPRLFAALEAQTIGPDRFEAIFVDDGSTDGTPETLGRLKASTPLSVEILGDGVNRHQGPARNLGWSRSRAPIVAFTDDDCVPVPDWLERGLAAMGTGRRVVVGRTEPDPAQAHLQGPFSRSISVLDATYFETCNIFYRKTDLEAAGGFDEAFRSHGGEDTDLGWRIRKRGSEAVFAPDVLVHHDVKPSSVRAAAREALRWTGIPRVVRLHPEGRRLLYGGLFWKPSHPLALGALAGILLAPRSRLALALALPWVWHRIVSRPLTPGPRRRLLVLPGALIVDLAEVAAMVRGSISSRTIVL